MITLKSENYLDGTIVYTDEFSSLTIQNGIVRLFLEAQLPAGIEIAEDYVMIIFGSNSNLQ